MFDFNTDITRLINEEKIMESVGESFSRYCLYWQEEDLYQQRERERERKRKRGIPISDYYIEKIQNLEICKTVVKDECSSLFYDTKFLEGVIKRIIHLLPTECSYYFEAVSSKSLNTNIVIRIYKEYNNDNDVVYGAICYPLCNGQLLTRNNTPYSSSKPKYDEYFDFHFILRAIWPAID